MSEMVDMIILVILLYQKLAVSHIRSVVILWETSHLEIPK